MSLKELCELLDQSDAIRALALPGIKFVRSRIYKSEILVLDFIILGKQAAFDFRPRPGSLSPTFFFRDDRYNNFSDNLGYKWHEGKLQLPGVSSGGVSCASRISSLCEEVLTRVRSHINEHPEFGFGRVLADIAKPVIVDVGANPVDSPTYASMLAQDLCCVVGFEPQREAYNRLVRSASDSERYFNSAVGKPGQAVLNIYKASGFSSLYQIDRRTIDFLQYQAWSNLSQLIGTLEVNLTELDSIEDLPNFDLLKIDIQGGELDVFRGGRNRLSTSLVIITEVSFFPLYEGAPFHADVDAELRSQGFFLHKFIAPKSVPIGSQLGRSADKLAGSQLIDGDAVYIRDLRSMNTWSDLELVKLCLLSHFVFKSFDLCLRSLETLVSRGVVPADLAQKYVRLCV
jgi:FkbM family methyltransferase